MRQGNLFNFIKLNIALVALTGFIIVCGVALNGKVLNVLQYWSQQVGFTMYIHLVAGSILFSIIILIVLKKIDEYFPSLGELELITEGSLVVGLIGSVLSLVIGFDELHNLNGSEMSLQIVIGIINKGLLSTGIGLCLSFSAWVVKKKFFPAEIKERLLLKEMRMVDTLQDTAENTKEM